MTAFNQAVIELEKDNYDIIVLTTASINCAPSLNIQFKNLGMIGSDGMCRFLDQNASGYVPSECVGCLILQKKSEAHRVHAVVLASQINADGYKPEGLTYPKSETQSLLLQNCLIKSGLNPEDIQYIECHGTGTKAGDKVEVRGIMSAIDPLKTRKNPLLVGSVKSNMGHAEMASGFCSIMKVLHIFKEESIPPNLHFEQASQDIPELMEGRIIPVIKETPFNGKVIPIGNYGFGGANSYLILANDKDENHPQSDDFEIDDNFEVNQESILFLCSGRTQSSLDHTIEKLTEYHQLGRLNLHYAKLVNEMSIRSDPLLMDHRGYFIASQTSSCPSSVKACKAIKPQLYFVFSGFGSQRPGMASTLMTIECFAQILKECTDYIDSDGTLYMYEYLTNSDCDKNIGSFVCLALAIFSISFLHLLDHLNIRPDGYFGHSFGHLSAAYYDGFFKSKEEFMQISKILSVSIAEETSEPQLMISVGESWQVLQNRLPDNVYPACFNSPSNMTLGGYTEVTKMLADQLKSNDIFVRELDTSFKAFHTPLFCTQILKDYLKKENFSPRYQSPKLIETFNRSNPVKHGEAESLTDYIIDLIQNPVQLVQACSTLPENAVFVEVSAKRFLAPLLKQNCPSSQVIIPLSEKTEEPLEYFYAQLGELFSLNIDINPEILYPNIKGPAPVCTPFLSSLIKHDHNRQYFVRNFPNYFNYSSQKTCKLESDKYLQLNERKIVPISYLLREVFDNFSSNCLTNTLFDAIEMKNVVYSKPIIIDNENSIEISIEFLPLNSNNYRFSLSSSNNTSSLNGIIAYIQEEYEIENDLMSTSKHNGCIEKAIEGGLLYDKLTKLGYDYANYWKNISTCYNSNELTVCSVDGKVDDFFMVLECMIQVIMNNNQASSQYFWKADSIQISCNTSNNLTFIYDDYLKVGKSNAIQLKNVSLQLNTNNDTNPNQQIDCVEKIEIDDNNNLDGLIVAEPFFDEAFLPQNLSYFDATINDCKSVKINHIKSCKLDQEMIIVAFNSQKAENNKSSSLVAIGQLKMGKVKLLSMKTKKQQNINFVWPIPSLWKDNDSSNLLLNLTFAFYALIIKGKLNLNQTCLVVSKFNSFIKAIIDICDSLKCHIYLVTDEKYLKSKESTATLSKSCTIICTPEQDVEYYLKQKTVDGGVDLVLFLDQLIDINSVLQCVRINGNFIQLSHQSMYSDSLGLSIFLKGISFIGINFSTFLNHESEDNLCRLYSLVDDYINNLINNRSIKC